MGWIKGREATAGGLAFLAEVCPPEGLVCAKLHVYLARGLLTPGVASALGEIAGEKRLLRHSRPYQLGTSRTSTPLQGKVKGAIIREADKEKNVLEGEQQKAAGWSSVGGPGQRDEKNSPSENLAPMMNGVWERRLEKGTQPGETWKGGRAEEKEQRKCTWND